jgi:hypothetical protein
MKVKKYIVILSFALAGCSPIDSLKPFDSEQADILLREHAVTRPARHRIAIKLPSKNTWKAIDLSRNKKGSPLLLIPRANDTTNWNESIRTFISPYRTYPDMTAQQLWQDKMKEAQIHCHHVTGHAIQTTTQSVYYVLRECDCQDGEDAVIYGKAFNGSDAVYLVYYTADVAHVAPAEISRLATAIKQASLV